VPADPSSPRSIPPGLTPLRDADPLQVTRKTRTLRTRRWRTVTVYAVTSLPFIQALVVEGQAGDRGDGMLVCYLSHRRC
jgi:hypothetical protein